MSNMGLMKIRLEFDVNFHALSLSTAYDPFHGYLNLKHFRSVRCLFDMQIIGVYSNFWFKHKNLHEINLLLNIKIQQNEVHVKMLNPGAHLPRDVMVQSLNHADLWLRCCFVIVT